MQSIRSFGFKGKRKLLSFLFISQCVCLRTWSSGIIGGEGTGLKLHDTSDGGASLPIQSSSSSSVPALRAIVHLHSSSDLKEGTQQDNEASSSSSPGVRRSYLESGDEKSDFSNSLNEQTEGGASTVSGSSDEGVDTSEVTFISEKEEKRKNTRSVHDESVEDQQAFFSALQVNESSGLGMKSSERAFSSSDSQNASAPPPPQCACEFAGNCLPKGSCLSIAFTLTGALLIVVIFVAWALQWIIAIPSEWIIAKGRYGTKASSSGRQASASGKEEEGRLLGEEKKSQALSDEEQKNLVGASAEEEEDDEETARRIAEGAGLPPPSRTESGRL